MKGQILKRRSSLFAIAPLALLSASISVSLPETPAAGASVSASVSLPDPASDPLSTQIEVDLAAAAPAPDPAPVIPSAEPAPTQQPPSESNGSASSTSTGGQSTGTQERKTPAQAPSAATDRATSPRSKPASAVKKGSAAAKRKSSASSGRESPNLTAEAAGDSNAAIEIAPAASTVPRSTLGPKSSLAAPAESGSLRSRISDALDPLPALVAAAAVFMLALASIEPRFVRPRRFRKPFVDHRGQMATAGVLLLVSIGIAYLISWGGTA